jgi:uncharacterized protein (DUF2236 family)
MCFGGPDAALRTARTLRQMHQRIKGISPGGRRYHAFEPEAWAWVHVTLGDAMIAGNRHFARPMPDDERERFGVRWTAVREGEFQAFAAASRATTPLMPAVTRIVSPEHILRWRRDAIADTLTVR